MGLRAFAVLHRTNPAYAADYERLGSIYRATFSVAEARRESGRKTKAAGGSAYD